VSAIADHLTARYGIGVAATTEIEQGGNVFRIDRSDDGPRWIARVFPVGRTLEAVDGDVAILRHVAAQDFPAERLARDEPVSTMDDGRHVLVTEHVDGVNGRPDRSEAMFEALGDLTGRLHSMPLCDGARPAGGWHHLSHNGGSRMADVNILLERVTETQLSDELSALTDDSHLPQVVLHPDLTSPNVMTPPSGAPVVIDWTGAGRGARVSGLGVGIYGAGAPKLIDVFVAAYRRHVELEAEELAALGSAVWSFPLVLDAWMAITYPPMPAHALQALHVKRTEAESMAARAVRAFTS
jgi:Ser/Thr protein kinase RdoA (MazF antagonist)